MLVSHSPRLRLVHISPAGRGSLGVGILKRQGFDNRGPGLRCGIAVVKQCEGPEPFISRAACRVPRSTPRTASNSNMKLPLGR